MADDWGKEEARESGLIEGRESNQRDFQSAPPHMTPALIFYSLVLNVPQATPLCLYLPVPILVSRRAP